MWRKRLALVVVLGGAALVTALAVTRRATNRGAAPAPAASASGADLRAEREALDTLVKLQKSAVAANAAPGYLAARGSAPAPACLDRMHREQTTTHQILRSLSKLPDTAPGISALRKAVFQVHICVSCTPGANEYCTRANALLAEARTALANGP